MNAYRELPDIHPATFEHQVLAASAERLMIVMFTAEWCMPCRLLATVLQQIQQQNVDSVRCGKIDLSLAEAEAQRFDVHSLPTLCFFAHGELVDRSIGLLPIANLQARIDRIQHQFYRG